MKIDEILIFGSLFLLITTLLVHTRRSLSTEAAKVPTLVLSIVLMLVIIKLIMAVIDVSFLLEGSILAAAFSQEGILEQLEKNDDINTIEEDASAPKSTVRITLWIIIFILVLQLMGFYIGIPALLFTFFILERNSSPVNALVLAILTTIAAFVVFDYLLSMPVYEGILWEYL